jgi:hypothetical protein
MAAITFVKSGVTTVTLSVAPDLPATAPKRPRQLIGRSESGLYQVVSQSVADQEFNLVFSEMPSADHDAIQAFLEDALINYSEHAFTYTDVDAASHQVRFLDGEFPAPRVAPGLYRVSLVLASDRGTLD